MGHDQSRYIVGIYLASLISLCATQMTTHTKRGEAQMVHALLNGVEVLVGWIPILGGILKFII